MAYDSNLDIFIFIVGVLDLYIYKSSCLGLYRYSYMYDSIMKENPKNDELLGQRIYAHGQAIILLKVSKFVTNK